MRVLVVEDFEVLARSIGTGLRREGMALDVALDGDDALEHLAVTRYDVVVLDRDLPGTHGDEVCRRLVAGGSGSRVLMLTAASTVKDRVDGLGLGADDYLPKPFDFAELVARVRALGRRSVAAVPPVLESGGVTPDPGRRVVFRATRPPPRAPAAKAPGAGPPPPAPPPRRSSTPSARAVTGSGSRSAVAAH